MTDPTDEAALEDFDISHKEVFVALGRFDAPSPPSDVAAKVTELLRFLEEFTSNHFAREQAAMASFGYPRTAAHKAAHETIRGKVRVARAEFTAHGPTAAVGDALREAVGYLLHDQMAAHDRALLEFVKERKAGKR